MRPEKRGTPVGKESEKGIRKLEVNPQLCCMVLPRTHPLGQARLKHQLPRRLRRNPRCTVITPSTSWTNAQTNDQKTSWVKLNSCCWHHGRHDQAVQYRLKVPCKICNSKHLEALHDVNLQAPDLEKTAGTATSGTGGSLHVFVLYLD